MARETFDRWLQRWLSGHPLPRPPADRDAAYVGEVMARVRRLAPPLPRRRPVWPLWAALGSAATAALVLALVRAPGRGPMPEVAEVAVAPAPVPVATATPAAPKADAPVQALEAELQAVDALVVAAETNDPTAADALAAAADADEPLVDEPDSPLFEEWLRLVDEVRRAT